MTADFARLTPGFLRRDANGHALMKALEAGVNYFLQGAEAGVKRVLDIDSMPEWRLDEMAWEMNILWYDSEADVRDKRQTVKDAQAVYDTLGTPEAVLMAVNGVFGSGRISEWYEYGGSPFFFRVYATDQDALDEKREQFLKMIGAVKMAGAVLDDIYYVGAEGKATAWTDTAKTGIYGEIYATALAL